MAKLIKDKSTPENQAWWTEVESAAAQADSLPPRRIIEVYFKRTDWHGFACQVAIAALLTREHWRWLNYGGLGGPGEGLI